MQIVQIVPTLAYGDAVGNDAMAIKKILHNAGYKTEIYAESVVKPLDKTAAKSIDKLYELGKENVAILHLSTGAKINSDFADLTCRKIVRYHNVTPPKFFAKNDSHTEAINKWALQNVTFLADKVDYCLAVSEFNKVDLVKIGYQCRIDVLPILIPFDDYKKKSDEKIIKKYQKMPMVLFTGRIVPNKKIEDIIRAFYIYKKYYNPKAVLVLAGSYKETDIYYRKLATYINRIGAKDVVFTGHIRFDEILAYYHCADIFLCQSEHEGFCVPLVEAMFFQIPVIAYKSSAIPFTLGKSGILMETKEPLLVAGMMNCVHENKQLREQIIEEEERRLEDFSYEIVKEQFLQFIDDFIKNGIYDEEKDSDY